MEDVAEGRLSELQILLEDGQISQNQDQKKNILNCRTWRPNSTAQWLFAKYHEFSSKN
jgi:hypothetical protein